MFANASPFLQSRVLRGRRPKRRDRLVVSANTVFLDVKTRYPDSRTRQTPDVRFADYSANWIDRMLDECIGDLPLVEKAIARFEVFTLAQERACIRIVWRGMCFQRLCAIAGRWWRIRCA
jgi:hypothetical protein